MRVRLFGGLDYLFSGGSLSAVGDIIRYRTVEQPGILQHHAVKSAQIMAGKVFYVYAVNSDFAAV